MTEVISNFPSFLLILVRVASFFVTLPLFSYRNIPVIYRIGLAFFLSWMIFFTLNKPEIPIDGYYIILILKESIVGLSIGLIAYMIVTVIQIAGGLIDFQMGFAIANVIDPQTGVQSPLTGQFLYTLSLLFLLSINGHHLILDGIFYSYTFIPLDQLLIPFGNEQMMKFILKIFGQIFVIAFQMSIPIVGSLFLVDIALGIVARTVPQLNIFVVGFPLKIFVSYLILFVAFGAIFNVVRNLFEYMIYSMRGLMQLFGGM